MNFVVLVHYAVVISLNSRFEPEWILNSEFPLRHSRLRENDENRGDSLNLQDVDIN